MWFQMIKRRSVGSWEQCIWKCWPGLNYFVFWKCTVLTSNFLLNNTFGKKTKIFTLKSDINPSKNEAKDF